MGKDVKFEIGSENWGHLAHFIFGAVSKGVHPAEIGCFFAGDIPFLDDFDKNVGNCLFNWLAGFNFIVEAGDDILIANFFAEFFEKLIEFTILFLGLIKLHLQHIWEGTSSILIFL